MSAWDEVNRVFREADETERLARMYMERRGVTWQEALAWVAEIRQLYPPAGPNTQTTESSR